MTQEKAIPEPKQVFDELIKGLDSKNWTAGEKGIYYGFFLHGWIQREVYASSSNSKFIPCGQGENICNCKSQKECGYLHSSSEKGDIEAILDELLIKRGEHSSRVRNPVYAEERKLAKDLANSLTLAHQSSKQFSLEEAIKKIHELSMYNSNHDVILYHFREIHNITSSLINSLAPKENSEEKGREVEFAEWITDEQYVYGQNKHGFGWKHVADDWKGKLISTKELFQLFKINQHNK